MIFRNIRTDFNFIFGQFSVARKLILNGGAIRPTGLLLKVKIVPFLHFRAFSQKLVINFFSILA